MGRVKLSKELYTRLFEAFALEAARPEYNGQPRFTVMQRETGVGIYLLRKTWLQGWDLNRYPWAVPVKRTMAKAILEARSVQEVRAEMEEKGLSDEDAAAQAVERLQENAEERQKLRNDRLDIARDALSSVARIRGEEAKLVSATRATAAMLLSQAAKITRAMHPLAEEAARKLVALDDLKPREAMDLMSRASSLAKRSVEVTRAVIELERKHVGEPDAIIKHEHDHNYAPTLEEAVAVLSELESDEALAGARRKLLVKKAQEPPIIIDHDADASDEEEEPEE